MDMVRHNHVSTDCPTMAVASSAPLVHQNCGNIVGDKNSTSVECTRRDEIDRGVNPDPVEAPEVTMHATVVAGIGDPGQSESTRNPGRDHRSRLQRRGRGDVNVFGLEALPEFADEGDGLRIIAVNTDRRRGNLDVGSVHGAHLVFA